MWKDEIVEEVRRIRGVRRSRHEMASRARRHPFDLEADGRGHRVRAEEREVVDHGLVGHREGGALAVRAHHQVAARDREGPEQPCRGDASVEVVHLRPRTGVEQIHSFEGEGSKDYAAWLAPYLRDVASRC